MGLITWFENGLDRLKWGNDSFLLLSFLSWTLLFELCLQHNSPLNSRNNNQSGDRNDNFPSPLITPAWFIPAVHRVLQDTGHCSTCGLQDPCDLVPAFFLTCLCLLSRSFGKSFTTPCSLCFRSFPQPALLDFGVHLSATVLYWRTSIGPD